MLPYGQRKDLLRYLVEGTYLVHEVRQITYSLRTYAVEHPRSEDGPEVYANLGPSITTDSEIKKSVMALESRIISLPTSAFKVYCIFIHAIYDLLLLLLQCMGGQNHVKMYMNQVMEERESFKERGLERHRERFGGGGGEGEKGR